MLRKGTFSPRPSSGSSPVLTERGFTKPHFLNLVNRGRESDLSFRSRENLSTLETWTEDLEERLALGLGWKKSSVTFTRKYSNKLGHKQHAQTYGHKRSLPLPPPPLLLFSGYRSRRESKRSESLWPKVQTCGVRMYSKTLRVKISTVDQKIFLYLQRWGGV